MKVGGSVRDLAVPKMLCAPDRKVRREWRRVVKESLFTGNWCATLDALELIPVSEAPRMLVFNGPPFDNADDDDNVLLYPVIDELRESIIPQAESLQNRFHDYFWEAHRGLLSPNAGRFWVSLSVLATQTGVLPRGRRFEQEGRALALDVLRNVMSWWEEICGLQDRYFGGDWLPKPWPMWAIGALHLCIDAGMTREEGRILIDAGAEGAGQEIKRWIANVGGSAGH